MGNKFIRNFIAKQIAGRSDDGIMITLKDPKKVDFQVAMMEDLLMRNGIDPNAITSENQFKGILNLLESIEKGQAQSSGITGTKSAKVFDLEGNKLDPNKPIMGGKQEGVFDNIFNKMQNEMKGLKTVDDLPPPGSRGGADDIAAPVMNVEDAPEGFIDFVRKTDPKAADKLQKTEDEIKAAIEAGNKRYLDKIKKQKEEGTYKRYNPEEGSQLDLEIKEEYQKAIRGESKLIKGKFKGTEEDFRDMIDEMTDDFATGGRVGLKVGSGKKFLQRVFGKEGFETMKTRDPEMYQGLLEVVDMYRKRDKEGLKMYLQKFLPHMDDAEIEDFIRGSDGSEGLIGELIRLGSGRDYAGKIEMIKRSENIRKLDDLEVTDDMIRKPNADGGIMRLGLKEGSGMSRRTFLKILGGAMSIPIIGKFFKPMKVGKTVTKVPIIKTDNVPGKPEWFDQLVNKVIIEGDEVTKKFATKEREIVHVKRFDDDTNVMVTQDLDEGAVRVEYNSADNVYGDPVQMQYKKPLPDEGAPNPAAEFDTAESYPVGRADGPDDYSIDIDEVGGTSISDLTSDVSKLKEYATGQKQTLREFVQSKKRKDKARRITEGGEAEMDAVIKRQGEFIESDLVDIDPPDFASGGIARMLGE